MKLGKGTDEREQLVIGGAAALMLAAVAGGHVRLDDPQPNQTAAILGALEMADRFIALAEQHVKGKQP